MLWEINRLAPFQALIRHISCFNPFLLKDESLPLPEHPRRQKIGTKINPHVWTTLWTKPDKIWYRFAHIQYQPRYICPDSLIRNQDSAEINKRTAKKGPCLWDLGFRSMNLGSESYQVAGESTETGEAGAKNSKRNVFYREGRLGNS